MTSKCRACQQDIQFLTMPGSGKQMPVDARQRLMLVGQGKESGFDPATLQRVRGLYLEPGQEQEAIGKLRDEQRGAVMKHVWVPHWSTCSDPKRFRREKARTTTRPAVVSDRRRQWPH